MARAEEESWGSYVNPRFGYELKYPKTLVPEKEPDFKPFLTGDFDRLEE